MTIEIKSRTGKTLKTVIGADLYGANLYGAALYGANLYGAKIKKNK